MARRLSSILFLAALIVVLPASGRSVRAQQPTSDAPPTASDETPPPSYDTPPAITLVDGTARLLRQGQSQAAVANMPLVEGDRILTEAGRVAVTFPDGSLLHVDRNTTVDFLSMNLMRLLDGRVILVTAGQGGERPSVDYQIDAPAGSVRVQEAGEYKVSTGTREVELDVVTGAAALATDQGSVQVQAGERSFAREGEAPSYAEAFNSARFDAFDQWSESQRSADVGSQSSQYLPSDLYPYSSTFDRYGRWENDASYGYVWYPSVSVGWRPYYNGYWDSIGPYGSTWIGYDPWCWPTLHFGRWGFRAGLWFWVPGRHWGPAWVSWAYSPGYYSWCPLDFYNRPVFGLFFGRHYGYRGFYDPWLGWTVLPRHRFGPGYRVANYAVAGTRLTATERTAFAIRRGGPEGGVAVPRAGLSATGPRAVPRALSSVTMGARTRDSMLAGTRAMPRSVVPGATSTASRYDRRSLPYSTAPVQRYGTNGSPGAIPRGSARGATPYSNTAPSSRALPRGVDRGPVTQGTPGRYQTAPYSNAPSSRALPRGSDRPPVTQGTPRRYESAPYSNAPSPRALPRGGSDRPPVTQGVPRRYDTTPYRSPGTSSPSYSPPPTRGPSYSMPRYSSPGYSTPRYSAPSYSSPSARPYGGSPGHSAPASPRYSTPSYSAPSPRYSAPSYSAPRSSSPGYSAPRGPSGGYAAPRSGGGSHSSGGSSRPAPSGGGGGGHRGGGRGR